MRTTAAFWLLLVPAVAQADERLLGTWHGVDPEGGLISFSHLDLAAAAVVSEGWLTIEFEIGRTVLRRFGVATWDYQYQNINDGWYIRTCLRWQLAAGLNEHAPLDPAAG